MIKIKTYLSEHVVKADIFPDGTSQVWKLPQEVLDCQDVTIIWNFEAERELIDLLSLRALLPDHNIHLHIPFLPYGRQDKEVANDATFNLAVLGKVLNTLNVDKVTSVDTHNPGAAADLINYFTNVKVDALHQRLVQELKPDFVLYPDSGAANRYKTDVNTIVAKKVRDQATGNLTKHEVKCPTLNPGAKILIIDDICDGGATFISIAKLLRQQQPDLHLSLFVTHGIWSKGRANLLDNGINALYTTNSLLQNKDGYEV